MDAVVAKDLKIIYVDCITSSIKLNMTQPAPEHEYSDAGIQLIVIASINPHDDVCFKQERVPVTDLPNKTARLQLANDSTIDQAKRTDDQDATLIAMLVSGEVQALDVLYRRYARPVFSLALRIVGNEADAEEVMQDVLERVWRRAPTFDPQRGRFGSWLLGMTHHVAIDALRKRQRRPQAIDTEAAEQVMTLTADPRVDVAETVIQNEQAHRIRQALQALPEAQQQAIDLAFFKGLSHLEIAAATGDPLGTVKTRIRRGMERLKAVLSNEAPGE